VLCSLSLPSGVAASQELTTARIGFAPPLQPRFSAAAASLASGRPHGLVGAVIGGILGGALGYFRVAMFCEIPDCDHTRGVLTGAVIGAGLGVFAEFLYRNAKWERPQSGALTNAIPPPPPLSLTLEAPREVEVGRPVPFHLVLRNNGLDTITVGVPGGPHQAADFVVSAFGREVWEMLRHSTSLDMLLAARLAPRDSLVFDTSWLQNNNRGHHVGRGEFVVQAVLLEQTYIHRPILSNTVAFRIR